METLTTILFISIAIFVGLLVGVLGFTFVIIVGVMLQMSIRHRRNECRLYDKIVQLEKNIILDRISRLEMPKTYKMPEIPK